MPSSQNPSRPVRDDGRAPVLVAEAGASYRPGAVDDPVGAWIALMEAVEALCPRWPLREQNTAQAGFRL
jgi:hypothetical protein